MERAAARQLGNSGGRAQSAGVVFAFLKFSSELSRAGDADLSAHGEENAGGAFGPGSRADEFAKRNEAFIDLDPVLFGQLGGQRLHARFRRGGVNVSPAVSDAMNMNVNGDKRLIETDRKGERGNFRADAPESGKPFNRVRHASAVFIHDLLGQALEVAGLWLGKRGSMQ